MKFESLQLWEQVSKLHLLTHTRTSERDREEFERAKDRFSLSSYGVEWNELPLKTKIYWWRILNGWQEEPICQLELKEVVQC